MDIRKSVLLQCIQGIVKFVRQKGTSFPKDMLDSFLPIRPGLRRILLVRAEACQRDEWTA